MAGINGGNLNHNASDFYLSGHFRWQSAYRNADISGCGFAFGIQENGDQYAVFLDRSRVLFRGCRVSITAPLD